MTRLRQLLHAAVWTRRHLAGKLPAPELFPLLPYLRPDDVFLDVGAHAGSWSIPASRVLTGGHVFAFEAFPYYAQVLKTTLALLRSRNITVVIGAASDAEGEVEILWKDASGRRLTGMTHISSGNEQGEKVAVRALTVDGFCRQHAVGRVRLLKCDVEGAELMVLRGAAETIDRWRPLTYCEIYEEYCARYRYKPSDIFQFFASRQYLPMQFEVGTFHRLDPAAYSGSGDVLFVPVEMNFGR